MAFTYHTSAQKSSLCPPEWVQRDRSPARKLSQRQGEKSTPLPPLLVCDIPQRLPGQWHFLVQGSNSEVGVTSLTQRPSNRLEQQWYVCQEGCGLGALPWDINFMNHWQALRDSAHPPPPAWSVLCHWRP